MPNDQCEIHQSEGEKNIMKQTALIGQAKQFVASPSNLPANYMHTSLFVQLKFPHNPVLSVMPFLSYATVSKHPIHLHNSP